ncbi:MAG: Fic family protein [Candidatus Galacturonibacter soehngenii]|nr:Fic family protein [Candidatus Galacturonibacter soehngenii]
MVKDPYTYENGVLINKLGIKDEVRLKRAEADITFSKLLTAYTTDFSYDGLMNLHKHILGDIYPFAGEIRTIPIVKSEAILGGDTVRYSFPNEIKSQGEAAIKELNNKDWSKLNIDETAKEFSKLTAKLWQVHPFREGNTRTIITFVSEFAKTHGFELDINLLRQNSGYVRNALVKASDGQYAETGYLEKIIKDSIITCENSIKKEITNAGFKPTDKLIDGIKAINKSFGKLHSVKEIKELYEHKNELAPDQKETIDKTVKDFKSQELSKVHEMAVER